MTEEEKSTLFKAINAKRFGPPSHWEVKGRPKGWHLQRDCAPHEASMHDNGINDALMVINEIVSLPVSIGNVIIRTPMPAKTGARSDKR